LGWDWEDCGRLLFLTEITENHRNNDLAFGLSCYI